MNSNLRLAGILSIGVLLAFFLGACEKRQPAPMQRPPMTVQTAPAVRMDTPVIIEAFGNTDDRMSVDIVPQVSGTLVKTLIKDGAAVTNGQVLFLIDSSDYASRARQLEGLVAAGTAALELSRGTLERNKPLLAKELISADAFDTLKARLAGAEAQLQADQAALDQARLNLARCTIASTVNGICSKRYVDDGNLVAAGQTRLTNIRGYDPMNVEFSVSEQHLPLLRKAMLEGPVSIVILPRGDTNAVMGTLEFIDNAVNSLTGTILLRGQAPNPDKKLWARQFVGVKIVAGIVRDAVMVPEGAVQYGKQGPYLFVVTNGPAAARGVDMRLVKPGVRFNNLIQLVEGVQPGEAVVTLGQFMLFPGAPVAEAPPPAANGSGKGGMKNEE